MADQKLTAKQDRFAQLIAQGKGLSEAYKEAYPNAKGHENTIYKEASLLAVNPKVSPRIAELKRQNENTAIWTRIEALERLKRIAEEARMATSEPVLDGKGNMVGFKHNSQAASVELKSIEQAAKMCGFNEPDKVDTNVSINSIETFLKTCGDQKY